ncbi:MAG: cobalt-zinc-cadmium efflux system protein [Verrucomicrobiales bacterium]|jgi:cobalt-zinc-cadmium efflux system protein
MAALHDHHHHHETLGGAAFAVAVAINVFLTFVEVSVGLYAGSTALIADALHNMSDAAALVIAWWARRVAARKADGAFTFGYRRAELVAAVVNLTALIVLALSLANEAVMRLFDPVEVHGGAVAIASVVAIVVDIGTAWLLWKLAKGSLNLKAAFLHNLSDAGFSVAVLIGGLVVLKTGMVWIDSALTLALAVLMIVPSLSLLKQSARILMLGAPPDIDTEEVRKTLLEIEGVADVHHLHFWQIDESTKSVEAHLTTRNTAPENLSRIISEARAKVLERHQIAHGTYQVEPAQSSCDDGDHHA